MAYVYPLDIYTCWPEAIDITVWICSALNDPFLRILS